MGHNPRTDPLILEPHGTGAIYFVQKGDNLTWIANRQAQQTLLDPNAAIDEIMGDNPHITNRNLIFPGQPIFLRSAEAAGKPMPVARKTEIRNAICKIQSSSSPEMSALVQNSTALGLVITGTDGARGALDGIVRSNRTRLTDLISQHQAYRANGVTSRGYRDFSRARTDVIQKMQRDFGKATKPMLGATAKDAMTLKPGRSARPTQNLSTAADRLSKVSKGLKAGGAVLAVADVAVSAEVTRQKVCAATSRQKKNEELVSGVGGIGGNLAGGALGAAAGGVIVGIALGSNPAGWAVLLIVGASAAAGGWAGSSAGGAGAKKLYTEFGDGYDIVDAAGVDSLCQ